jgi:low temperature requirement protein LtrA
MSDLAEAGSRAPQLLRDRGRSGAQRVTNIELFFDLVYVFAVTQLSHYLLHHATVTGALQSGLLLAMVWLVWVYTTWVTNWLDPDLMAVRLLLVALMLISLAMSASLPRAFEDLGLWIGGAYAVQQIGRTVFMVIALRGHPLEANFQRILAWCVASSALAVAGGVAHGHARVLLWLGSVGIDLLGGVAGFWTPGLGRSRTSDWTIDGGHIAERCQAFILIALGESIVIIGATLSGVKVTAAAVTSFAVAFAGAVALWWLYFDQSADAAAEKIARSDDPGRLARSAYHLIHPVMVAGIIVCAAADEQVLSDPGQAASTAVAWMVLGGPALFLAGHAAFKFVVWRVLSWPRLAGIAVLALLALAAHALPDLALDACAAAVVIAVAITDRLPWIPHPEGPAPAAD